jgi:hypothetical protein
MKRARLGRLASSAATGVEEILAVMRQAGIRVHGARARVLIVGLWRARLRSQEALSLAKVDLDVPTTGLQG